MNHITPDITEADIILPTIQFSKQRNYNLKWHRRHVERRKEDQQQWTTQEAANAAVDELAGRAWDEEFVEIQHHQIAPHYRHSKVVQTILSDGSILGNLVHTIPEAITTLRGKPKLQEMLQMNTERMELIDKEITASNARKFVRSSIAGPLFSKQYTQQWYTDARAHYLDKRILRSRGRDRWYIWYLSTSNTNQNSSSRNGKSTATPIKTNNATAFGYIKSNIRQKRSKSWDMKHTWLRGRDLLGCFQFYQDKGICFYYYFFIN